MGLFLGGGGASAGHESVEGGGARRHGAKIRVFRGEGNEGERERRGFGAEERNGGAEMVERAWA